MRKIKLMLQLGPFFLLCSQGAVLMKYALPLWPYLAVGCLGFFLTAKWKKQGFALSLLGMILLIVWKRPIELWPILLACSFVTSWFLEWIGYEEGKMIFSSLLKSAKEVETSSEEVESLLREKQELIQKVADLSSAYENLQRETPILPAFQHNEVPQEIDDRSLSQLRHDHVLLRAQFQEKSELLDQARKELFLLENQFLTYQREIEERGYLPAPEQEGIEKQLSDSEQEIKDLELQIQSLQEIIRTLSEPKKSSRKPTKKEEQDLPLLLQEKIEETQKETNSRL